MSFTSIAGMFHVDIVSIIMIALVSFIGIIVCFFSRTYMKGDALYRQFFLHVLALMDDNYNPLLTTTIIP